jgi:hypothetical protein
VPGSQTLYSHHDRQHKPDKRPTKHPDAVAGKLHTGAQHLGLTAAKFTPWVPMVLGSDTGPDRRGVGTMEQADHHSEQEEDRQPSV